MTPRIMASAKSWITSPPKKNRAIDVMNTVEDVTIVLERTSFMLRFMTLSTGSFTIMRRFSLILSKTTTVSVREYPAMVSSAVTRIRFISPP